MKKIFKTLVCLLICFSVLLSLVSCEIISTANILIREFRILYGLYEDSDGYTGGFPMEPHFASSFAFNWFETYDELMEALNRTRAYGTKIPVTPYFDCEEEYGVDVKFCVLMPRKYEEDLKEGQDCFDQYIYSIGIHSFVFFDEVSIDELVYSDYSSYRYMYIKTLPTVNMDRFTPPAEPDIVNIYPTSEYEVEYEVAYGETPKFRFDSMFYGEHTIDKYMDMLKSTIAVIK